jgi:hypothetical protein
VFLAALARIGGTGGGDSCQLGGDRVELLGPPCGVTLGTDREQLTSYPRFPIEHHRRVRHFIERIFGETRRRVKVIGRLPGETSCLSLVWAVLDRASARLAWVHHDTRRNPATTRSAPPTARPTHRNPSPQSPPNPKPSGSSPRIPTKRRNPSPHLHRTWDATRHRREGGYHPLLQQLSGQRPRVPRGVEMSLGPVDAARRVMHGGLETG